MYRQIFKDKANGNRRLNYCAHSQEIRGRSKRASKNSFFSPDFYYYIYIFKIYIILRSASSFIIQYILQNWFINLKYLESSHILLISSKLQYNYYI